MEIKYFNSKEAKHKSIKVNKKDIISDIDYLNDEIKKSINKGLNFCLVSSKKYLVKTPKCVFLFKMGVLEPMFEVLKFFEEKGYFVDFKMNTGSEDINYFVKISWS